VHPQDRRVGLAASRMVSQSPQGTTLP